MAEHKLKFNGTGTAVYGECCCGTCFLATFTPTARRAGIKAQFEKHRQLAVQHEQFLQQVEK
jgi:hypothetical protein